MTNPPGWVTKTKLCATHGKVDTMAGIAAGVVGAAEVNSLPKQPTKLQFSLKNPSTWTYIWVTLAFLYLLGIYLGMITIGRRG